MAAVEPPATDLAAMGWLNTLSTGMAALDVDGHVRGRFLRRTRSESASSIGSYESGYTSTSSDEDDIAEVLRTDTIAADTWHKMKGLIAEPSFTIECVVALAMASLKLPSGCSVDRVVDAIRKHVPYYEHQCRATLVDKVTQALEGNKHFSTTTKSNRLLWTCSRSRSKISRSGRQSSFGKKKSGGRKRTSSLTVKRTALAKKSSLSSGEVADFFCGAGNGVFPVADDGCVTSLLDLSSQSTPDLDLWLTAGLESVRCTPSAHADSAGPLEELVDDTLTMNKPTAGWLPTTYIPGPTGSVLDDVFMDALPPSL